MAPATHRATRPRRDRTPTATAHHRAATTTAGVAGLPRDGRRYRPDRSRRHPPRATREDGPVPRYPRTQGRHHITENVGERLGEVGEHLGPPGRYVTVGDGGQPAARRHLGESTAPVNAASISLRANPTRGTNTGRAAAAAPASAPRSRRRSRSGRRPDALDGDPVSTQDR